MRLALVHGFTQTGQSWGPIRSRLEQAGDPVLTPELSGHGSQAGRRGDLVADAERMAEEVGEAVWVGYSMGGRLCLHLAVQRPDVVAGLVLVSTTAGLDSPQERAARREADEQLARSVEDGGVDAFVDRWLAGPLWATLPPGAAGKDIRKANTASGLAHSLRSSGTGAQAPLWDHLQAIRAPVLIVTGSFDDKFRALGARLAGGLSGAAVTTVEVPGAGHAVPWEQPDRFVAAIQDWRQAGFRQ